MSDKTTAPPRRGRLASAAADDEAPPTPIAAAAALSPAERRSIPYHSVVKIFVVAAQPNYLLPWQMGRQESCTGSGFVVHDKMIITNAHVVREATNVRVRRHGDSEKFSASVMCINHACDLAIIAVDDAAFWANMAPLTISPVIPHLFANVVVVGFPMGGDNICVTRGVVSRVTTLNYQEPKYYDPGPEIMAIQIDAAINSGNSGGPVLDENNAIVGVAFSGYAGSADNIGYIIPWPVISNFLAAYRSGAAAGDHALVANFGFAYMPCENHALRRKHQMGAKDAGVLVTRVQPLGCAAAAGLREGDILCAVGAAAVSNDGTTAFRGQERLSFEHLITNTALGAATTLHVLRDGARVALPLVATDAPRLVPRHRARDTMPAYLVVGGLVLTTLSYGLLDVCVEVISEEAWSAGRAQKKSADEQVVVIVSVLAHPVNQGYEVHRLAHLTEFNGAKVTNLRQVAAAVAAVEKGYYCFKTGAGESIVLDADECRAAEAEILTTYAIPAPVSADLRDVLAGGGAAAGGEVPAGAPAGGKRKAAAPAPAEKKKRGGK